MITVAAATATQVFIGIGSNLDQPFLQVKQAIFNLQKNLEIELKKISSFYETTPLVANDNKSNNQLNFVNAVVKINTSLSALELLHFLQSIENEQGRVRKERWGSRTIDLDILLFGKEIIVSKELTIPHYALKERDFFIYPLYEIAPDMILPSGESIYSLKTNCLNRGLSIMHDPNSKNNNEDNK